ncbi:hypothetical protein GCM10011581_37000 [Saccharopolyspora subtropica]|uniref:Uncharacterized protein n=1 Tax=Saccharopolyspora thermophila TaxID=89367 RepID=A0A917K1N9_9PSEU|nr:hypothetical protein GCM10011581_37000 [Saccharopolyspora subtropica]
MAVGAEQHAGVPAVHHMHLDRTEAAEQDRSLEDRRGHSCALLPVAEKRRKTYRRIVKMEGVAWLTLTV